MSFREDLGENEFHEILDCSIRELLEKAWEEQWKIKHIEFWLKVKNAQMAEEIINLIRERLPALDIVLPGTEELR